MKTYYFLMLFAYVIVGIPVYSQSSNQNYIATRTYTANDASSFLDEIQYYDGLGRPIETVQAGITPSGKDLISYQEYDGFGRESNVWLPGAVSGNGAFQSLATIKSASQTTNNDTASYSYPVYEASPLNRVLQQFGAGGSWHGNKKSIITNYLTNASSGVLACSHYEVTSDGYLKKTGDYSSGQLYVTQTADEDGNTSYEFKDKLGQVILTRQVNGSENLNTYYVYDDFGKLRFVLSPMASDGLTDNTTWNLDNQTLKNYAYIYKYDYRLRCIWKKLPGCEPEYYVYDFADRLVLSQDGVQRESKSWTFNKYDELGRIVITGVYTPETERSQDYWINLCKESVVTEFFGGNYGYTWNFLTEIPYTATLLVNHYDDYEQLLSQSTEFRNKLSYTSESGYGTCYTSSAKGLLVGTRAKIMNGSGEIVTAIYYDSRGRVIQTKSTNLLGGTEAEYIAYDFTGHPTAKKHVHTDGSNNTTTEVYAYTYDHAGRLLKTTHSLNGIAAVTLAENTYDDLGRLKTTMPASNSGMKETYSYNVRSWLTEMTGNIFSQNLYYNDVPIENATPCYNGNISTAVWNNNVGFYYTYDKLSRLTSAFNFRTFTEGDVVSYETLLNFYFSSYSYDKNGNIRGLYRREEPYVENIRISHSGNQISKIDDYSDSDPDRYPSFVSYSNGSNYTYNANGAMSSDPDKGAQYTYDAFGMPLQVKVPAILGTIDYKYSATGERLEASYKWHSGLSLDPLENVNLPTYTETNSSKLRQYVGNKIYENGSLKRILLDNGYIENGIYYFYLRDHLGNNCVVARADGEVIQENYYHPYGKTIGDGESSGQSAQPYKFGGKEDETMFGLDMYDFHARQMDYRTGKFLTVDPLAEKYYSISPYAYCAGNPINRIDPDGKDPGDFFRTVVAAAKDWGKYYNGASILRGKEMSSSIYVSTKNGVKGYSYSVANTGENDNVKGSSSPNGEKVTAIIHSHGEYEEGYDNNNFSNADKWHYYDVQKDGFVSTPNGSLQKYDVKTTKTTVISTDLPSDPKDPDRKNKNNPKDIPLQRAVDNVKKNIDNATKNVKDFIKGIFSL